MSVYVLAGTNAGKSSIGGAMVRAAGADMERGQTVDHCELATAPDWVKPILLIALRSMQR